MADEQVDPEGLAALIRRGDVDTVLTVFPDGLGRLMGHYLLKLGANLGIVGRQRRMIEETGGALAAETRGEELGGALPRSLSEEERGHEADGDGGDGDHPVQGL